MPQVRIREGRREDSDGFLELVDSLAAFEKLEPPSPEGKKRLVRDVFAKKRARLLVAVEGDRYVGYALYFYTYSSFEAKPTLYLEDLYVLDQYRQKGVGFNLFRKCIDLAIKHGCGRMEWAVLDWNVKAQDFYTRLGAKRLEGWQVFRLDEPSMRRIPKSQR